MTALFALDAVNVSFGRIAALSNCTLSIHRGETIALVGANGSGKTSLLRTLHGLVRSASGGISVDTDARQAMLHQRPYLLRTTVVNNVALGLWLNGVPWAHAKVRALQALARVGLLDLAQRNARALSGGQQQRVALARAWALAPQVLLLDEPTASLDPSAKREVERLMAEFSSAGMTLIFSSHNLGQVKRLASRVIYLERGCVVADRSTQDFFNGVLPTAAANFLKGELV